MLRPRSRSVDVKFCRCCASFGGSAISPDFCCGWLRIAMDVPGEGVAEGVAFLFAGDDAGMKGMGVVWDIESNLRISSLVYGNCQANRSSP